MQPEISLFRRKEEQLTLPSTLENSKPDLMFTRVNLSPQGIENHADGDPEFNDFRAEKEPKPIKSKLPHESSPRLKSLPVNHPLESNVQQRRTDVSRAAVEDVSCVGFDCTPFPESNEGEHGVVQGPQDVSVVGD
ncbi:hypothetical protein GQ457_05G001830 [Hibiscus cannabinus]